MKNLLTVLLLSASLPMSPLMAVISTPVQPNQPMMTAPPRSGIKGYRVVDTKGLQDLIDSGKVTIVDSRSAQYDDGKRIPGARSLPYNASPAQIASVLPDREAIIVTYCAGPRCPMGNYLAEALIRMGYQNVMKYTDGLEGWQRAGKKVDQAPTMSK